MLRHCHIPARFLDLMGAAITEGEPMRSLWRILALEWLRGDGSEALTADSAILEGLPYGGNVRYRDNRADRVHLELSGGAVLRYQDGVSTSPWRVMSVRQSETPAPPRREDKAIELARTNLKH